TKPNVPIVLCKGKFEGEQFCCKLNGTEKPLTPDTKSPEDDVAVTQRNFDKQNYTSEDTTEPTESDEDNDTKTAKSLSCGAQRPIINVRIFTGEDELTAVDGEFPWIVAIFKKKESSESYTFHCSGSLIHPKVIMTANHCVNRKRPGVLKVILNGKTTLSRIGRNPEEERNVNEIIEHSGYYAGGLYNDVALLVLNEPYVSYKQNHVNSLCLPSSNTSLEGIRCLVAGWGKDGRDDTTKIMKKVELPYINFNRCQDLIRKKMGDHFNLHKSFMCAGGEKGKDACKGDGGSPLMCAFPFENRFFQIGIVSWGIGCGEENVPGVYGNVQEFAEWIKSELRSRDIEL
ncbi:hypothetical protein NQ317_010953, partial [Molorchus minor]